MSTDREAILTRVREALAPLPRRAPLPDWESEWAALRQPPAAEGDAWPRFAQRLQGLNGTPLSDVAALVALLEKNQWYQGYCDPALWPRLQAAFDSRFTVETTFDRTRVDDY